MDNNEIKNKIKEIDNRISQLRIEKDKLKLELAKQNTDYVGRYFEMKNMNYVYVKSYDEYSKSNVCIAFDAFKGHFQFYENVAFDINNIETELTKEEFLQNIKSEIDWDFIKKLLDGEV